MADSDTSQHKQITISLEVFNELKAITENIRAKAAAREAAARKAAAREAAARDITNIQPELDEAESEEANRKAREKLFANSLLTMAELWCVGFLFGSLVSKALF